MRKMHMVAGTWGKAPRGAELVAWGSPKDFLLKFNWLSTERKLQGQSLWAQKKRGGRGDMVYRRNVFHCSVCAGSVCSAIIA